MQPSHRVSFWALGACFFCVCFLSGCFGSASSDLRQCSVASDCLTGESCIEVPEEGSGLRCLKVSGIVAAVDTAGVSYDVYDVYDTLDDFTDPPFGNYYFVRINDQSPNIDGINPGADLDAVSITKARDGSRYYVQRVEEYEPVNTADISGVSILPDNVLGQPTAFGIPFDPVNAGSDKECSLAEENFVALGGPGGYIIVSFGDAHVENGDALTVYEIGNCANGGKADPVEVQVSVSSAADGNWLTLFSAAAGPVMSGVASSLP